MKIVNLSEMDPNWGWMERLFPDRRDWQWAQVSDRTSTLPSWLPRRHTLCRLEAGWRAAGALAGDDAVLVTHGPRPTMYGSLAASARRRARRHLAFSFNFTDLPQGLLRSAMARAYRRVDRFVVFSTMERTLYARHFDLPVERFDMLHWAVQPPRLPPDAAPIQPGDYICAVGGQGRDYRVLADAMRLLPAIRLVVVGTPASVAGIDFPDNVRVILNAPWDDAMNVIAFSRFMVLPLRDTEVPCGHVTLVAAMYLGKAVAGTDSAGVHDYLQPGITGECFAPHDPLLAARAIEQLHDDPSHCARLGAAGRALAEDRCSERRTVDYFDAFMRR